MITEKITFSNGDISFTKIQYYKSAVIENGEIVSSDDPVGDDYECSDEDFLEEMLEDEDFIFPESLEDLDFEQTEYSVA